MGVCAPCDFARQGCEKSTALLTFTFRDAQRKRGGRRERTRAPRLFVTLRPFSPQSLALFRHGVHLQEERCRVADSSPRTVLRERRTLGAGRGREGGYSGKGRLCIAAVELDHSNPVLIQGFTLLWRRSDPRITPNEVGDLSFSGGAPPSPPSNPDSLTKSSHRGGRRNFFATALRVTEPRQARVGRCSCAHLPAEQRRRRCSRAAAADRITLTLGAIASVVMVVSTLNMDMSIVTSCETSAHGNMIVFQWERGGRRVGLLLLF